MDPAMYLFLNKGLGMSTGKSAAQACHAAVEAYRISCFEDPTKPSGSGLIETDLVREWYKGGHYKKLVMQARDETHLYTIERYLTDRGFKTALIVDEGMTEIAPHTATALGVAIVDKDDEHTAATFSRFRTYKEDKSKSEPKRTFWQKMGWYPR